MIKLEITGPCSKCPMLSDLELIDGEYDHLRNIVIIPPSVRCGHEEVCKFIENENS